jgi:hypothetical protein
MEHAWPLTLGSVHIGQSNLHRLPLREWHTPHITTMLSMIRHRRPSALTLSVKLLSDPPGLTLGPAIVSRSLCFVS